jgi:uncharacterized 2Fe-2S/4Fe-4S cluster protein (DUF4445 family)
MPHTHRTAQPVSHTLHFSDLDRSIESRQGESLYQSARRHGVRIVGACGGRGTCGSCVVRITQGHVHLNQPEAVEPSLTPADDAHAPSRKKWLRACQVHATSDCVVEIAPRSLAAVVRAEAEQTHEEFLALDAAVHTQSVQLQEATLADPRSDMDRLSTALALPDLQVDLFAARQLSPLLRANDWRVDVHLRGNEVIGFAAPGKRTLGLAVDLGTTNAAGFLIDLSNGQRLVSLGLENPQVAWGGDVIARVNHAIREADGGNELREAAIRALNALAHDLCHSVDAQAQDIVDMVVCGNSAMQHLLLGLPVAQLGRAPFVAAVRAEMDIKARDLGLQICPGAYVHVVANVGGFVGGDHVAALLASQSAWSGRRTALLMDIGTNTEITLLHDGQLYTSSSPSGPALEGGHISCGMRAAEGAIERVRVSDGRLAVQVIGGGDAVGLCGSGVLDTLAALHQAGIVDARGRITAEHPDVCLLEGKRVAQLAHGVTFSQDDVRAVQLAKSAIRSVCELLLREADIDASAIEHFAIAGSFGAYISVESAIAIGLLPDLPRERFEQVGNAAGQGSRQMLASKQARQQASELARQCQYLELSSRSDFQKVFLHHIGFPSAQQRKQS